MLEYMYSAFFDELRLLGSQNMFLSLKLYRHGDRSPVAVYPKDPNTELSWPMGLGQLTNVSLQLTFLSVYKKYCRNQ